MTMFSYKIDEHIAVLTMNGGENRFNPDFIAGFNAVLDEIENETEASVLVVESADEKIWSNGIDLAWLMPAVMENPETMVDFFLNLQSLLWRLTSLPMITIASINGHAFAGGGVLACTFDFRFMRSDRGYFCLPEVDLKMSFLPGMCRILDKALPEYMSLESQITGRRYKAEELVEANVAVRACHLDDLLNDVMAFARTMNKDRATLKILKSVKYQDIFRTIKNDDPGYIQELKKLLTK